VNIAHFRRVAGYSFSNRGSRKLPAMRKLTLAEIQADAARRGGRCLSESYVDSLTLMDWECAQGHKWRAVAHAVRQGHWCKKCADARLRCPAQAVHEIAGARGGVCLSPYSNSQAKLEWQCKEGHRWWTTFSSVKQGSWCPHCKRDRRASRGINGSALAQTIAMIQKASPPSSA
jgi:hypothetical protein